MKPRTWSSGRTGETPPVNAAAEATRAAPAWAVIAAYIAPLLVLPSAAWRLHAAFFESTPCHDPSDLGQSAYMAFLSVSSLALASLTIGLVRPWGELFPRWIPWAGGRPTPAKAVILAGLLGGGALCGLTAYVILNDILHLVGPLHSLPSGCEPPGFDVNRYYLPLAAWGSVVLAVTLDYRRRHLARGG